MANTNDYTIDDAIQAAIEKGTFSLQAVESIKALRDRNLFLADALDKSSRHNEDLDRKFKHTTSELEKVWEELKTYKKRESEILGKEIEMVKLVSRAEKAEAVTQAVKDTMALAFKSPVYYKSITGQGDNGSYISRNEAMGVSQ